MALVVGVLHAKFLKWKNSGSLYSPPSTTTFNYNQTGVKGSVVDEFDAPNPSVASVCP